MLAAVRLWCHRQQFDFLGAAFAASAELLEEERGDGRIPGLKKGFPGEGGSMDFDALLDRVEAGIAERLRDGAALFPDVHVDVVPVGVGKRLLHLQAHDGTHAVVAAVGDDFLPDVRAHILVKARVAAARLEARLERLAGGVGLRVVVHGAEVHLDALFRLAHAHAGAGQLNHLLLPCGRDSEQLDLASDGDVELLAGHAHAKDAVAAPIAPQTAACGQPLQFGRGHFLEQRQGGKVAGNVELLGVHGVGMIFVLPAIKEEF